MPPLMTLKLARTFVGGTTMAGGAAGALAAAPLAAGWDADAPLAGVAGGAPPVGPAPPAQAAASRRISRQPGAQRVMVVSPVALRRPYGPPHTYCEPAAHSTHRNIRYSRRRRSKAPLSA